MKLYAIASCPEGGYAVWNDSMAITIDARRGAMPCFAGSLADCLDYLRKVLEAGS